MVKSRVPDFMRWLNAVANRLLGPFDPRHDDLVSEGAIAMWRAEERYVAKEDTKDPEGEKVAFMIKCAETRMKDFAWRDRPPTGHEPMRGSKPVQETTVLDGLPEEIRDSIQAPERDIADLACIAYHHGQIYQALDGLSPAQRMAAYAVMHDQQMTKAQHNQWYIARERLASELAHLAC